MGVKRKTQQISEKALKKELLGLLEKKYDVGSFGENEIKMVVNDLSLLTQDLKDEHRGNWSSLKGSRILNLSCSDDANCDGKPGEGSGSVIWMCRALFELGAEPTAVMADDCEGEPFNVHQFDLSTPEVLGIFPAKYFDAVIHDCIKNGQAVNACEQKMKKFIMHVLKDTGIFLNDNKMIHKVHELVAA